MGDVNLPKLKRILTDPDEFISNSQLKSLSMELLELIPMEGIEGSGLDSDQIMEVVLRAAVDQTSVNGVTTSTEDTPNRETVMDWLHTLEKETMLDAVNDILALVAMTVLDRDGSRTICIDFMNNPFHGCPDDEDEFRRMSARDGTTKCHRYCTAFVLAQGKPLTLAVEPVDGKDSKADAVERVLARVETYPFEIDQILMDRDAFCGELIGVLREAAPPVFPVRTGKETLEEKLTTGSSYMTEEIICEGKEHEQTYPLAVNVTYQNGDRGKSGLKQTGYAAYGLEDRTPRQVAQVYNHRAQIEKSYETFRKARALTTTPSTTIRLFYVGVGFLLEQLWVVLQWAVLARPRRGGRALPTDFTFNNAFLHGVEEVLDDELGWKDEHQTNGQGLPAGHEHGLG
ncbi:ISH3-like element ISHwa12 family transposase [Haloquadratum walsbyi]|uniref:ISH3-type transposase ISHwa12 n=1 Tax=Haloquadratum walsbyi (strain DSM 16854 / JCM 12705 / C23) TaxID=768065 RepID=G0LKW5_HALWC|nr:ISH3-like element ISHwa12 family transposase [Haloquadratum walsbyi]CCC40405.1 ISH3-type transposase ISHwa12 [Haloquadratum walsbyi C23]